MGTLDRIPVDVDRPTVVFVAVLLATNAALVAGLATSGSALGPYNDDWDGGSALRTELAAGTDDVVMATETDAYGAVDARETVAVVVSPSHEYDAGDVARLDAFLANGGTLVLAGEASGSTGAVSGDDGGRSNGATDAAGDAEPVDSTGATRVGQPAPANALLESLGSEVRLNGTTVLDERHNGGDAVLPRATSIADHPLVEEVDRLTLSRGTVLDLPGRPGQRAGDAGAGNGSSGGTDVGGSPSGEREDVTVLAETSPVAYLDRNGNGTFDESERLDQYPVAAVERMGEGRLVVVSDATLFTNSLLERDGNRAFVRGLAASADTAVLDYSNGPSLAPLTYLLLVVRKAPLLQSLVGVAGLGAIGLWLSRPSLPRFQRVLARIGRGEVPYAGGAVSRADGLDAAGDRDAASDRDAAGGLDVASDLDAEELAAVLRRRNPDWDADRVERVSQTIIRQRRE